MIPTDKDIRLNLSISDDGGMTLQNNVFIFNHP